MIDGCKEEISDCHVVRAGSNGSFRVQTFNLLLLSHRLSLLHLAARAACATNSNKRAWSVHCAHSFTAASVISEVYLPAATASTAAPTQH